MRAFEFLVSGYGYTFIGRIPLVTQEIEVRGWENRTVGMRIEVSGYGLSGSFDALLRRFVGGAPASYGDPENVLSLFDVALVRDPSIPMNHNLYGWRPTVDAAARLLRENAALLTGRDWISHAKAVRARKRDMRERFGWTDTTTARRPSTLDQFRQRFAFLLDLGFVLVHDSATLSPHEYAEPEELRYARHDRSVRMLRVDFRDAEWAIQLDGQSFGPNFIPTPDEITAQAEAVRRALGEEG